MKKTGNVAFLINDLGVGGAERALLTLTKEWVAQGKEFYLITVFPKVDLPIPETIQHISLLDRPVARTPFKKALQFVRATVQLRRLIAKKEIRTLNSFLFLSNYLNLLTKRLGSKHRAIISNRSIISWYDGTKAGLVHKVLIKTLFKVADIIVNQNKGMEAECKRLINSTAQYVSISNPFDIARIQDEISTNTRDYPFLNDPYILSVGRLVPVKRQPDLIEAFARLDPNVQAQYKLVFVGSGPEKKTLESLAQQYGLSDQLIIIEDESSPYKLMAHATLYGSMSQNEGFPNAIVEAMCCRTPVIASDCDYGPREILDDGNCGRLYPVGDIQALTTQLSELLSNEPLKTTLVERAWEKAQGYHTQSISTTYWNKIIEEHYEH